VPATLYGHFTQAVYRNWPIAGGPYLTGTHLNKTGGVAEADCFQCELGKFAHLSGMDNCLLCPPGTFMNETGAAVCTVGTNG